MSDTNVFVLKGRLVRDSELTYIGQNNTAKLSFSLANGTGFGEYEKTHFFECYLMGKRAEALAQYLVKGKEIVATGEIEQDRWEDKNTGDKRSKVKFFVRSIDFTSGGKSSEQAINPGFKSPANVTPGGGIGDDIPF